jgi:hypothetical protein
VKDDYDGAEPSAGSVSVLNLLTLSHLSGAVASTSKIESALGRFGPRLGAAARVLPLMAAALAQYHTGLSQVVVVGPAGRPDTERLRQIVASRYLPFTVQISVEPGAAEKALAEQFSFIGSMELVDGKAAAYVCTNFACQEPTTDPERFEEQLRSLAPGGG